jgi:methyltransferase (TIGR00027 family)
MQPRRASFTARFVAASRGLSPLLPSALRLVDDPHGVAFASPVLGALVGAAARLPAAVRALAWGPLLPMLPWAVYMQVRTRFFDDATAGFVRGGGRQVVILGAGFDARATRLRDLLGEARVFEVDHPATQEEKVSALAGAPSRATYLAWDFERDPMTGLPARLAAAGHDPSRPTFTLWEGVTMYLSREALDATLDAVRAYSAPGSVVAFNYADRGLVEHPGAATRAVLWFVRKVGEPFRTGLEAAEVATWAAAHGFTVRDDRSFLELARALLPTPWWRLVRFGRRVATAERSAVVRAPDAP